MTTAPLAWETLAPASVLESFGKAVVKHGDFSIAVFKHADQIFAIEDRCPHSGASLCVGRVENGHVQCPAHGLRFRLTDGLLANSPPGSGATSLGVRAFPTRLHEGQLQIQITA